MKKNNDRPKKTALFFCLTGDYAFAVACVLMDVKKYSPDIADTALIYNDGISEKDKELINSIFPAVFVDYLFPVQDTSAFHPGTAKQFTTMVYAKYEPLKLLDEYSTIILLDYDIKIQGDISELLFPSAQGFKIVSSENPVAIGLREYIGGYDLDRKSFGAGLMVFHDNLLDYKVLYDWCYKKTETLAPYLSLPEQAVYDLLFQEFDITPEYLDGSIYNCHPTEMEECDSNAKILHAWGQPKFWNGIHSEPWQINYNAWLGMGGKSFCSEGNVGNSEGWLNKRIVKPVKRVLRTYTNLIKNRNNIARHSQHFRYYLSDQFKVNTWTLEQCKRFGEDFEEKYFSGSFIQDFDRLLSGLDGEVSKRVKFLYLRMLTLAYFRKKSLYSQDEKDLFLVQEQMKKSIVHGDGFSTFRGIKFINGDFTLHNFVNDMGLKLLGGFSFPLDRVAIDVGAYVGDSAFILEGYVEGSVHAFEPLDQAYSQLIENIQLNDMDNRVIPLKKCLSDVKGTIDLHFVPGNLSISTNDPGQSLSKGGKYDTITVDSLTLDFYVDNNNLTVGIIKIDAEGAERKVLSGAKNTIVHDKPILLISIYHNVDDFLYIKPWVDSLGLGYKYLVTKPESTTFIEETMLVCY